MTAVCVGRWSVLSRLLVRLVVLVAARWSALVSGVDLGFAFFFVGSVESDCEVMIRASMFRPSPKNFPDFGGAAAT